MAEVQLGGKGGLLASDVGWTRAALPATGLRRRFVCEILLRLLPAARVSGMRSVWTGVGVYPVGTQNLT